MDKNEPAEIEILAQIQPSQARFWGAFGVISGFGLFLMWIALSGAAPSALGSFIFVVFSLLCFVIVYKIRATQGRGILLTREGLFDTTGRAICALDEIEKIERSFFAFKPSNGFLVRLKTPLETAWVPGLWWRFGRRVGIGGITSVSECKAMADTISIIVKVGLEALEEGYNPFAR